MESDKKLSIINSVLYFILYSLSLGFALFEYGVAYPNTDGIGFIWLFPIFYLVMLAISVKFIFVKVMRHYFLIMAIVTFAFIFVLWGMAILVSVIKEGIFYVGEIRNFLYPMILFIISCVVSSIYLILYKKE